MNRRRIKRRQSRQKRSVILMLMIAICIALTGCGESAGGAGGGPGGGESSGSPGSYTIPPFLDAAYNEAGAEGNEEVRVDTSSVSEGYVGLFCQTDAKVKFQVLKDEETYTYDVAQGQPQIFPLQMGDGVYTFKVMKNLQDSKYFELYKCEASVTLQDEFQPFLRPSAYVNYTTASNCVSIAGEMAASATGASDFVSKVYEYVCDNVEYDYDKASTVASGYLPDPDSTISDKKGICFDYAALAASMLRSQGIPTKMIFGYVAPDDIYHAWNMFYTEEDGWISVEFKVSPGDWNRIDLTFSANGEDSSFIGDGSNYMDVYQY